MTTYTNVHSWSSSAREAPDIRFQEGRSFHREPSDHCRRIYGDALERWTNEGGALRAPYPSVPTNAG